MKGLPIRMSSQRGGKGRPIDQTAWPAHGKLRDWLVYCDKIHQANGLHSLTVLAAAMHMASRSRIGEMLRGLSLPVGEKQARALLLALGAEQGAEVDRGLRCYRDARDEQAQAQRPGWWLRSGYVQQVGDIAPLDLLDRQDELAELAAWCGGDETYVWWQAAPRAGKSALMAWFVLHPPPGVWVVSFFVTARYTGQADSTAFTDELIDQLAAITGQQVPPVTSARERDRVRRQLLDAAAARARAANHRLVLLVDGLDEDCGSLPGSGLPSIAKCLPKYPADGVRVIVASRPDPPPPADVLDDPDHPLLRCRVRELAASPHARQLMQLAQTELNEVLAIDTVRNDGLGFQVLGLVTASGGGLTHNDLQQLTGRPAVEIDRLLGGLFGRTVAGRADQHAAGRVFLFTHETLRTEAINRLGQHILAGFVARLHIWADIYRVRGWPADTPPYLLRGYSRMLADANDVGRLVSTVTDSARHERMRADTGGNAAAIAEIAVAQTLVAAQSSPDLLQALRLAWHRDRIADRNVLMPPGLPAVWVALGQLVRAEALAGSISHPERREEALAELVVAFSKVGAYDEAERVAGAITEPEHRTQALTGLARGLAHGGEAGRAAKVLAVVEDLAGSVSRHSSRTKVVRCLAGALAAAGAFERAAQVAQSHEAPVDRTRSLAEIARTLVSSGEHDRALAVAAAAEEMERSFSIVDESVLTGLACTMAEAGDYDRAESVARALTSPERRARAYACLARQLALHGDRAGSAKASATAEQTARSSTHPFVRASALINLSRELAVAGIPERAAAVAADAEAFVSSLEQDHDRDRALIDLTVAVAACGAYERARRIAGSIATAYMQAEALTGLARTLAAAGEIDHGAAVAAAAEKSAMSEFDRETQLRELMTLASSLAAVGANGLAAAVVAAAEPITRTLDDLIRSPALAELAQTAAKIGQSGHAEIIAQSIDDAGWQAHALIGVAGELAVGGWRDRAVSIATAAEQIARTVDDHYSREDALASLAGFLTSIGEYRRAEVLSRSLTYAYSRDEALAGCVRALARTGAYDRAERLAHSIEVPELRIRALTFLIRECGTGERVPAIIEHAMWTAESVVGEYPRGQELAALAEAVAATGSYDAAENIARSITNRESRSRAMSGLIGVLDSIRQHERATALAIAAETVARSVGNSESRARALADLAVAIAAAGLSGRAEQLARSITEPDAQARALTDMARAAEPGKARSLVASALVVGRWTVSVEVLRHLDPAVLSAFAAEYLSSSLSGAGRRSPRG